MDGGGPWKRLVHLRTETFSDRCRIVKATWKTHRAFRGYEVSSEGDIRRTEEGVAHGVPEPVFSSCRDRKERCVWVKPIGMNHTLILRVEGLKKFADES